MPYTDIKNHNTGDIIPRTSWSALVITTKHHRNIAQTSDQSESTIHLKSETDKSLDLKQITRLNITQMWPDSSVGRAKD